MHSVSEPNDTRSRMLTVRRCLTFEGSDPEEEEEDQEDTDPGEDDEAVFYEDESDEEISLTNPFKNKLKVGRDERGSEEEESRGEGNCDIHTKSQYLHSALSRTNKGPAVGQDASQDEDDLWEDVDESDTDDDNLDVKQPWLFLEESPDNKENGVSVPEEITKT